MNVQLIIPLFFIILISLILFNYNNKIDIDIKPFNPATMNPAAIQL